MLNVPTINAGNDLLPRLKPCLAPVETFSRVTGFFRPLQQWNLGKQEEYKQRRVYSVEKLEAANV
jgi:anaerobic ribonucleoside-triphosphate reductase